MQAGVDLTLDYRTYRIAALLSESFSLGALRGVSLRWQGEVSSEDEPRAVVSRSWGEQIEERYLVPRRK